MKKEGSQLRGCQGPIIPAEVEEEEEEEEEEAWYDCQGPIEEEE